MSVTTAVVFPSSRCRHEYGVFTYRPYVWKLNAMPNLTEKLWPVTGCLNDDGDRTNRMIACVSGSLAALGPR